MIRELFSVNFIRILILMICGAVLFYAVYPKYYVRIAVCGERYNKITGAVEEYIGDNKWEKI